ncbi:MAG: HD domain-containing protein [Ruminococcaceae bacterium]|nr:HD domain-containing protein [Oscillospiraceae bacterium]
MFVLPHQVEFAINKLHSAGYEAFIVGGCVRDILRGDAPSDYDITTSAEPKQTKVVFKGERIIETGLKHGTVTLLKEDTPLEITTYRIDGDYTDNRRPDSVKFTKTLTEDLARRDFTINAMAYSPKTGVVDAFGGENDLKNGIIRSVGDADRRFNEDALRIMRALRFSSVLGFIIESETKKSILKNKNLLKNISAERIAIELVKLLCGKNAKQIILEYFEVLEVILPEIIGMKGLDQKNRWHIYDVLTHTAVAVENSPENPVFRLTALLHDCGKPDTFFIDDKGVGHFHGHPEVSFKKAKNALKRLKFDNATTEKVLTLIKYHDMPIEPTKSAVKKALNLLTPELFFCLLKVKRADNLAQNLELTKTCLSTIDTLEKIAKEIIQNGECFCLKDLAVNGNDLISAGIPVGKEIGEILNTLLNAVINEEVENEKNALLSYLAKR